ncbi:hypothetical protein AB0I53_40395 [Saccharopolyspora sp. NPDC050389]|uniref:hypothetical protein n=1 Tax=Saccharopolyspora sp. NPDC050389 TaxID=3155516 RepID=UPI0034101AAA
MTVDGAAEVTFTSMVYAREMRFHEVPDTQVEFTGHPGEESVSGSERTHLPDPVLAGVTYREVHVDYRIVSRLRTEPGCGSDGSS